MAEEKNIAQEYAQAVADDLTELYNGESKEWDALDYIDDNALDIEYTADYAKRYLGARLAVTLGGPNCYIDLRNGRGWVECYWGTNSGRVHIPDDIAAELDATMHAIWTDM